MFQGKVKILSNNRITGCYFKMKLGAEKIARSALPGQFLEVKVTDKYEPLWRRPFSIHRAIDGKIVILYEVIGKGTQILSQKKPGQYLDVIGPLGSGFDYHSPFTIHHSPILVAGGMGVAPLVFLAEKLAYGVERIAYRKNKRVKLSANRYPLNAIVLIGAKTKKEILCEKEFKNLGYSVKIATDDGSSGFKGRVTDLLKQLLWTMDYGLWTIYTCGPKPMLREITRISRGYNIPAQISLEAYMACGFGACLGCTVKTKSGYKLACKDGPVFFAEDFTEDTI